MAGELGHKEMTIGMDITPFLTNEKQLESQLNRQTKLMKQQEQYANLTGRGINSLTGVLNTQKSTLSGYNSLLQKQQRRYNENLKFVRSDTKANVDHQRQLAQSATQLENTKMKIATLTAEMQKNQAQIIAQSSSLGKAGVAMTTFGNRATAVGKGLTSFGKTASMFTLPIMAGLGKAAKSAVDFKSEIAAIGPLLTNGGRVTATVKKQLDSMAESSKKWSTQYGISTGDINAAISELVKRGFTANQTIGSMKSILDATRASGEDMGDVMNVTASVIEQFGMKADTTAQQTKNTQRAVDALTYIANATASDFKSMGDAMTYVGPIANQTGMSIEETAAALGLMANKGIDASTGGTALRAALSRLVTPSDVIDKKMAALGINVEAFRKGSIGLPEVIEQIEKGTKGMTKAQKAGAIAAAFGKQAQGFTSLLGSDGAKNLRTYTAAAKGSAGATAEVAKQLNNTPEAKIQRFKESLNVLAITLGDKLLPAIMPVVDDLTKLANKFGDLPSSTQKTIVKIAAATALMGPLSLALGKPISAIGTLSKWLGKLASNKALSLATKEAAKGAGDIATGAIAASKGASLMSSSMGKMAETAVGASSKTGIFSNVVSKLPRLLGVSGLAVAGTAAAVGAGILIWEGWGKKAYESGEQTRRWGTKVGDAGDKALDKITGFQGNASLALEHFDSDTAANAKSVNKSFDGMSKTISDFAKKSNDDIQSAYNTLDPYLQALAKTGKDKKIASNNAAVKQAKDTATAVINITKNANKQRRDLTSSEHEFIVVSQKQENQNMVSLMGLSAKQQKMVLKNLNGDIGNLTQKQANTQIQSVKDSGKKIASYYSKQYKSIATMEKEGAISHGQANQMRDEADQKQGDAMQNLAATAYELQSRYGDLNKKNMETGRTGEEATLMFQSMGITLDQAREAYLKAGKSADTFKDSLVAVGNSKWDQNWNMSFLYDAEKGVMRTKGQLVDFVKQATKSKDKWNNLKLIIQKAKISPEGLEAVAQGIDKAKAWNKVDLKTWTAMLETQWGPGAKDTWDWWIANGSVSKKDLQLALTGDYSGLRKVIDDAEAWNNMQLGAKELFVKDEASIPFIDALHANGSWNEMPVDVKNAIVNGDKAKKDLGILAVQYGAWDSLPDSTKNALLNDNDFVKKLQTLAEQSKDFSTKSIVKKILGDDSPLQQVINETNTILGIEDKKKPKTKVFNGDNHNLLNNLSQGNIKLDSYEKKKPQPKVFKADSSNMIRNTRLAQNPLDKFKRTNPGVKNLVGKDKTSGPANAARNAVNKFGGNETITKRFNFVANIGKSLQSWWNKLGHNANGTRDWRGGLSWVGDGGRSEVVYQPKSKSLITTPPTDTLMPLEKHAIVWPSVNHFKRELSKSFPRYATGTANRVVETAKYIPEIIDNSTKATVIADNSNIAELVKANIAMMNNVMTALQQVANRPIEINAKFLADMREIGIGSAKYVRQEINRQEVQERRSLGFR